MESRRQFATSVKAVEAFTEEWVETILKFRSLEEAGKTVSQAQIEFLDKTEFLNHFDGNNFVSANGYDYLRSAAELVLHEDKLQFRVRRETAQAELERAFATDVKKLKKRRRFSPNAIVKEAKAKLHALPFSDGLYVFPAIFAPNAIEHSFLCGPIEIVPKARFLAENKAAIENMKKEESKGKWPSLAERWEQYIGRYDHFVTVHMDGFESERAWVVARESAEFLLNLVRMTFTFQVTERIKLAGGFIWDESSTFLMISPSGGIGLSSQDGPWGSHLDNDWTCEVDRQLGASRGYLSSLAALLTSGKYPTSPILERLRYANQLISEAYCEPHDHIRLVRIVSALEALALVDGNEKARPVAVRCACAGGWSDTAHAMRIFEAVSQAYHWRNAIVHGDPSPPEAIKEAFLRLEQFLVHIYEGFVVLFGGIWNAKKPETIRDLRREVRERIDLFFWSPELATSDG
ncbi:hypothetical protein [Mesorhizobium sp. DCY119]|uniref:hypothetical protein n=1 Tax=Mesorhizobium sp. DCY119 TaxID=2108445 RepID=UPI000E6D35A2|nr:hypothetical protein [Mesorhizobium sp. DCY119]RJG46446.1 hypothetical protein D3Y55_20850 [Mesorhizobium sp. DCY119]